MYLKKTKQNKSIFEYKSQTMITIKSFEFDGYTYYKAIIKQNRF